MNLVVVCREYKKRSGCYLKQLLKEKNTVQEKIEKAKTAVNTTFEKPSECPSQAVQIVLSSEEGLKALHE